MIELPDNPYPHRWTDDEYHAFMRRMGTPVVSCRLCEVVMYAETEYELLGACCDCVRLLAHEFVMKHCGEPMRPFSSEEQIAAHHAWLASRSRTKKKKDISHSLRKKVFERDAYRCKECGDHRELQVDHIHPESKGGTLDLDNLQTLCRPCNMRKGARVAA